MGADSKIEWTDATWNPIVGCSVVSPGCTNCYAMGHAARIVRCAKGAPSHYDGTTQPSKAGPVWTGKVALAPDHILTAPLRWSRPRRIFVNSMGDLFHESVPDAWIDRVFAVMALAEQHTFQIITKRAKRMREYASRAAACGEHWLAHIPDAPAEKWPLPNVWLGVSAEDQTRADERIPELLETPAAVRFVSAEPLLGPLDLLGPDMEGPLTNGEPTQAQIDADRTGWRVIRYGVSRLDWIIVGGESGPGARPMHPQWARDIRDQCERAGVPFFMKQMGGTSKRAMPLIPDDLMIREFPNAG